ncbi:MAG: carph-isopro domain-containing protein [Rhodospirillaceae bacterium]
MARNGEIVDCLVKAFGGLSAMARALGHAHASTVQGWAARGAIPRWRFYEIRNSEPCRRDRRIALLLDRLETEPAAERPEGPHDPVGCRYIAGDPKGEWAYCNKPLRPGSSYCAAHHALCRLPPEDSAALAEVEEAAR